MGWASGVTSVGVLGMQHRAVLRGDAGALGMSFSTTGEKGDGHMWAAGLGVVRCAGHAASD